MKISNIIPHLSVRALPLIALLLSLAVEGVAQELFELSGTVNDEKTGEALSYVNVVIKGTSHGAATDVNGFYRIRGIPRGASTVVFSSVGYQGLEREISIGGSDSLSLDISLATSEVSLAEVSVYGASLKRERITEAPAAVSVIDPAEIKLNASSGQLPRLLEAQPGVDIVQSGVQDFNVNTRGFNSSLNRRLLVLQDGRDLSIAFLGAQEWNGLTMPLDDVGRLELVRGPGSALYGPNAFNGVINVTTAPPKDVQGTKFSVSLGELNTLRADVRQAGVLSDGWSYKANFGKVSSGTWSKSRTAADTNALGDFEYPGLRKSGIEVR
jgi:iron complex outermembrane receptor protein